MLLLLFLSFTISLIHVHVNTNLIRIWDKKNGLRAIVYSMLSKKKKIHVAAYAKFPFKFWVKITLFWAKAVSRLRLCTTHVHRMGMGEVKVVLKKGMKRFIFIYFGTNLAQGLVIPCLVQCRTVFQHQLPNQSRVLYLTIYL